MSTPKSYEDIMNRIREVSGIKSAAADTEAVSGIKDPADQGKKAIPDHPDGDDKTKTKVPASEPTNTEALNDARIPGGDEFKVSGTGEDVPSTVSGDAKDEAATSPTAPIDKIASLMGKISALNKPASVKAAEAQQDAEKASKEAAEKDEATQQMEFTPEFHMKVASIVLGCEEGIALVEREFQKSAGIQAARELIAEAGNQQFLMAKAAADQQAYEQAVYEQAMYEQAAYAELTKNASEEDLKEIERMQNVHTKVASALENDFEKAAYQAGAMDAAAMEDSMAAGEEVPEEAPAMGPEEIIAVLDEAVQSGELDEETAMALAEQILAEEGGEGGEEGMEMPEEDMAMAAEAEKMASELIVD
jgi:hypothetical protein